MPTLNRWVEIFYNFTPNRFSYYYFTSESAYYTAIQSHIINGESLDNARLMNNVLSIKKPSNSTYDYTRITYVRENRDGFIRYYFVVDVQYFGDGVYQYTLTPDKWANYIAYASFDHIFLQRCNRHLSTLPSGRFDDIGKATKYNIDGTAQQYINYTPLVATTMTDENTYIAFSVVFNSYKQGQLFANTIVTSDTNVFVVKLRELLVEPSEQVIANIPLWWIERGLRVVGGIYAMNYQSGSTWGDDLDAYVSGMWLVHRDMIPNIDNDLTIRFKTAFSSLVIGSYITPTHGLYIAHNSFVSIPYTITVDPNCDLYFGTKSAMLKLPRVFDNSGYIKPFVECIVKKDDIQIIARCGDDQLDISQSFSLGVPNATGATSSYEKIARGVQQVGALAGAVVQGVGGNYLGMTTGAFNAGFGIIKDNAPNAQYKSNGDGLTTWVTTKQKTSWGTIEYPISYTKYKSAQGASETERALRSGATFNQYISSIANLFTARAIVTGIAANTVFVQATMDVENIPVDAAEYIASRFADGIELIYVS